MNQDMMQKARNLLDTGGANALATLLASRGQLPKQIETMDADERRNFMEYVLHKVYADEAFGAEDDVKYLTIGIIEIMDDAKIPYTVDQSFLQRVMTTATAVLTEVKGWKMRDPSKMLLKELSYEVEGPREMREKEDDFLQKSQDLLAGKRAWEEDI